MAIAPGTRLGTYEVTAALGAGGMGEVYRATDLKLDREVAIKVLPDAFARDPERVQRFQREAKLLATLNHPNIAAIYGFEVAADQKFLVLELVEGETLTETLKLGPLLVDDALHVAKQVADALEAAHSKGVIHRDLKPGNVMLTPDGQAKVLDFGLAKALTNDDRSSTSIAHSPTITADFTRPGVVLGTAAYMSPEQARGKPIDKRTDIWSFGCLVFECLVGGRAFEGETATDLIAKILERDPEWTRLPKATPPVVALLLRRCLQKTCDKRLRDIGDARVQIEEAIVDPLSSSLSLAGVALAGDATRMRSKRRLLPTVLFGAALLAAGYLARQFTSVTPPEVGVVRAEIPPPKDARLLFAGDLAGPAVVSPDGRNIAFVAQQKGSRQKLWVRPLAQTTARPLTGTDGAMFPFWSPNGRSIGFFTVDRLRHIDLATGTVMTICETDNGRGGSWMADGTILYSPDFQTTIHRISASGGESTSLTVIDPSKHTSHRWPSALPDGKHFLYSAVNHNPGLVEESTIFLASLDGSSSRAVLQNPYNAMVGGDKLLFVREETLLAATLDVGNGRITGDPVVVARNVAADLSTWRAAFSASATGVLAFHRANASVEAIAPGTFTPGSGGEATQAQWYDRNGQPLDDPIARVPQLGLRLSPDGERVAVSATTRGATDFDLWIYDAGEAAPARVTFMAGSEAAPVWSPDGAQLAFAQIFGASYADDGVFIKRIGGGVERRVVPAPEGLQAFPTDWSRDGKYIAYTIGKWIGGGGADIWALDVETGKSVALVAAPSNDGGGVFSPNGKWMAYQSNESGVMEVYVIPSGLPPSPTERSGEEKQIDPTQVQPASQRWQISVGGGSNPRWRDDGKELYYMSPDGMLMAVAADSEGDQIQLKSMTPLFQTDWELGKAYDVAPGGQRFIVNEVAIQDDTPISIVVNWQAGLGRDEGRLLR